MLWWIAPSERSWNDEKDIGHFPIVELAAALARSTMTVKRSLNELEDAGLILRVRQGFGEPNKIYVLIPKKEDRRL